MASLDFRLDPEVKLESWPGLALLADLGCLPKEARAARCRYLQQEP